jgi:hypothetical protein
MRTRRLAAAVGSACFLGGIATTAVPADAGVYLSLRPVESTLPAGSVVSGSNTAGWTLTLGASASQQTFQYDLVIQITSGTSATPAAGQLGEIFGAVRGTGSAGVTGEHVSSSGSVFSLDPNGTIASVPNFVAGSFTTARQGVATTVAGGLGGVGPQTGTFFNAAGQPSFFFEFLVGSTTTTSPTPSFAGLPVDATGVAVARASFNITGANVGDSASLGFVGGDGANGFNGTTRWASWSDSVSGVPFFSTHNFDSGLTTAVRNALSISFANVVTAVKGDFGGAESPDGSLNTPDGDFNEFDVEGFLLALNDQAGYLTLNPTLGPSLVGRGDFGGAESTDGSLNTPDGDFNEFDVEGFLLALNDPSGYAAIQPAPRISAIPEPGALGLLIPACVLGVRRRRS